mmetsp:Transcript_83076/g.149898  ORF Transcript_83076/g.149898 Transcript_83076/m.149898 type:complete len:102 (-) Transcript_83076:603-908(-)
MFGAEAGAAVGGLAKEDCLCAEAKDSVAPDGASMLGAAEGAAVEGIADAEGPDATTEVAAEAPAGALPEASPGSAPFPGSLRSTCPKPKAVIGAAKDEGGR